MPWRLAASIRLSSDHPATLLPLSVNDTGFDAGRGARLHAVRASTATAGPSRDLLREVLDDRQRRVRRRLAEAADRRVDHRLRQLLQERLIPSALLHQLERLDRADAARRALAARLLREELHQVA